MPDLEVWTGVFPVVVMCVTLLMAAFVYFSRPEPFQNRVLAVLLYLEGVFVGGVGLGNLSPEGSAIREAFFALPAITVAALPWVYLLLISTLRTPLVRPFASRAVRRGCMAIAAVVALGTLFTPDRQDGLLFVLVGFMGLLFAFGLAATFHAWRCAPVRSLERVRAGAFFLAFGFRDLLWILFVVYLFVVAPLVRSWEVPDEEVLLLVDAAPAAITLVYVVLLTFGILHSQLFDLPIRIKWSIRRGALVAIFVVVFFAVSESIEAVVEGSWGTGAGLAAAGLLAFATRRLERWTDRFADVLMPSVGGAGYLDVRKGEVYRAALEGIVEDGTITARERRMLEGLRRRLGLDSAVVARLEEQTIGTVREPSTPSPP